MYWLALALLATLSGTLYKFSRGAEAPGGEYRAHLTRAEKQALTQGQVVVKTQWAYNNVWHTGYHTGNLRIEPLPGGKLRFTQLGHWQDFYKGRLAYEVDYYPPYRSVGKVYDEAGDVSDFLVTKPLLVKNDTIIEAQAIYLNFYNRADTLAVYHYFYSKANHHLTEPASFWSYDVAGKRPVPPGWKFRRY